MKLQPSYLYNLTPLRGIAALLTVIYHVDIALGFGVFVNQQQSHVVDKLYLMVDFFFILSGFILCYVYGKRFNGPIKRVQFKNFAIARFARVYPLHFFVLLYLVLLKVGFLLAGGIEDPFSKMNNSWISIPTNLLLVQAMNVHHWFSWDNAAWSISTEWWMYMLFPFLVKPIYKLGGKGKIAVLLACIGGYLFIMYYLMKFVHFPPMLSFLKEAFYGTLDACYEFGFLRCLFGFVIGMVVYQLYAENFASKFFAKGYVFLLAVLGLFTCFHFGVPDVISVSFFPLILLSAAYGSRYMNNFFGSRPLQRIGDWSFSIYMIHQPLLSTIGTVMAYLHPPIAGAPPPPSAHTDRATAWLICLVFIAVTLVISYFTYRFVEVPSRNWINKKYGDRSHRVAT